MVLEELGSASKNRHHDGVETDERELLINALRQTGGNKTDAALSLGLSRRTMYNRIARYGISADEYL
jgi:transcriptional regulator of acetoin/glycerol metabolism